MEIPNRTDPYFFALDKNWCFTFVSIKAGRVMKRDPLKLIGKHIWTEFPEAVTTRFHEAYSEAYSRQQFTFVEEYYPQLGGWFENFIYPSPGGLSIYGNETTEKKAAEKKSKQAQAGLRAAVDHTEVFVWAIDREFRLITFNKAFERYVKKWYKIQVREGVNLFEQLLKEETLMLLAPWNDSLTRALAGETLTVNVERFGNDYQCLLTPITEGHKITGVSIFCYNSAESKARERELAEANKQIEDLKMMALRSVMNPHFIFSTLNSIQYYIVENDRINAMNYLSAFSKLIRGILNNAVQNKVRLSDELEMLKLYVSLELMRFENKFDFNLEFDKSLDADCIEIPSMLIQPFVENAIIHGLANKTERGTLKISVKHADGKILFEIDDDGIGREASMNFQDQQIKKHKSLGIALTRERLKLITTHDDVSFEIIDKENDGRPAGTTVKIWLQTNI